MGSVRWPAVVLAQSAEEIRDACGEDPTLICRQVFEWTGSDAWAQAAESWARLNNPNSRHIEIYKRKTRPAIVFSSRFANLAKF
jgi:hypothetical protein